MRLIDQLITYRVMSPTWAGYIEVRGGRVVGSGPLCFFLRGKTLEDVRRMAAVHGWNLSQLPESECK